MNKRRFRWEFSTKRVGFVEKKRFGWELSTKRGGFVEKKRFGWELSTKRAGFVDKRRFREEFSTKRGVFVDSIRTTQSSLKLYYQEVLYPTDLSYWDLHKCVRSDGYPLFSREFAPVLPICIL